MKYLKLILFLFAFFLVVAYLIFNFTRPIVEDYDENLFGGEKYDFILRNLIGGGPGKDGIPSIDNPKYLSVDEAGLEDSEKVFGVVLGDFVAAYPQDIMYWHEIVNEEVEGEKIAITYCPLTESIIGYKGKELGVSGELYNSNLVMYDRESDARIPQILGTAIEREIVGESLETFPITVTTFGAWKDLHQDTVVLSRDTGNNRDYDRNPYPGYDNILRVWFPLVAESDELKTKELVFGIENRDEYLAILKKGFEENYPSGLEVDVGGEIINVEFDSTLNTFSVDKDVKAFEVYWFAWYAYHPETELIKD